MVGEVLEVMKELADEGHDHGGGHPREGFARGGGPPGPCSGAAPTQEENEPHAFFANPKEERTKEFLSKVL